MWTAQLLRPTRAEPCGHDCVRAAGWLRAAGSAMARCCDVHHAGLLPNRLLRLQAERKKGEYKRD